MVSPFALLRAALIAFFAATLVLAPARAADGGATSISIETTVEYSIADDSGDDALMNDAATAELLDDDAMAGDALPMQRFAPSRAAPSMLGGRAQFGPFTIIDGTTARMAGDVTSATPRQFAAMMTAFPQLKRIDMVDCPGSLDEAANLALARAIRQAGLATHIPAGGSVRSGAVELFLAGTTRTAAADAEFGVHSWRDEDGREARDYPAGDPVHAEYLDYYREMGMDAGRARAFYDLTNSTPFDQVQYLTRADIARFVPFN